MVPAAQAQAGEAADNVGDDVVEVKVPAVGQEALQELGPDAEAEGARDEGEVEGAPAVGVDDPVEDDGEEEEGQEVEELVVDVDVDVQGGQAGIACQQEEEEEDSCIGQVLAVAPAVESLLMAWVLGPAQWGSSQA